VTLTNAIEEAYRVFAGYELPAELIAAEHRERVTLRQRLTAVSLQQWMIPRCLESAIQNGHASICLSAGNEGVLCYVFGNRKDPSP
jgi:hypothetical protein